MTKKRICLDNQESLDFDAPIEAYQQLKTELLADMKPACPPPDAYRYEECCNEIAVAVKKAIRGCGRSREEIVDAVNAYFGWDKKDSRDKGLSIHMLNNYLCRPDSYNMPIPVLHAIVRITGCIEPLRALADMEGLRLLTQEEAKMLALGKIDNALAELQRLKKTFRGKATLSSI